MIVSRTPIAINRAFYTTKAGDFCRLTASLSMDTEYKPFLKMIQRGGHILDAGCGSGRDSVEFQSRGYQVTAIDASRAMVQAAKSRGINARMMTFQRMKFPMKFDGIWACASLLHIPQVEMPAVLRRFAKALKPQGVLYVSLKEGHGEKIAEDGRFFSYFTIKDFEGLLVREHLFEIIATWKSGHTRASRKIPRWLNFLVQKPD